MKELHITLLLFQRPLAFDGAREGLLDGIVTLLEHCVSQVSDFRCFMTLWIVFQDIYVVVNFLSRVISLFPSTMSK